MKHTKPLGQPTLFVTLLREQRTRGKVAPTNSTQNQSICDFVYKIDFLKIQKTGPTVFCEYPTQFALGLLQRGGDAKYKKQSSA